jgi:hypothetical protein
VHGDGGNGGIVERFGPLPEGLDRIDVFNPPDPATHGRPSGKTVIFADSHETRDRVRWRKGSTIAQRYDPSNSSRIDETGSQGSSPVQDTTKSTTDAEEDGETEPIENEHDS